MSTIRQLRRARGDVDVPDYVGIGDKDEAVAYVAEFAAGWRDIPGAQEWVKATTQGKR